MARRVQVSLSTIDDIVSACSVLPREPIGPHLSDDEIIRYAMGQPRKDETRSIDNHLSTCDGCCGRIESLLEGTSRWSGLAGDQRLAAIQSKLHQKSASLWHRDIGTSTLGIVNLLSNYPRRLKRPLWAAWAFSLAVTLLSITVVRSSIVNRQPTLSQITRNLGLTKDPALSTDGNELVYAATSNTKSDLDIWLETIPLSRRIRLTSDPANDYSPSLSHDLVAFRSDRTNTSSGILVRGGIYIVSTNGGSETLVVPEGYGPRLSPDGRWLAYWTGDPASEQSQLYVMPSHGGASQRICGNCYSAHNAIWSSASNAILFWGSNQDSQGRPSHIDFWIATVINGKLVGIPKPTAILDRIHSNGIRGVITPEGWRGEWVYFSVHGPTPGIWKIRVSEKTYLGFDEVTQVTSGNPVDSHVGLVGNSVYYSVSTAHTNIWAIPVEAGSGKVISTPYAVTADDASNGFPSASDDGSKLAFISDKSGMRSIWVQNVSDKQERLIAHSEFAYDEPKISPDGSLIAYASYDPKLLKWNINVSSTEFTHNRGEAFRDTGTPVAWSSDKGLLLFTYNDPVPSKTPGAGILDLRTGTKNVFQDPNIAVFPNSFSPDGRWVAFHTRVGPSQRKIWIAQLHSQEWPAIKEWVSIIENPSGADMEARWSPNGRLLYFLSDRDGHRCVWAQRVDPQAGQSIGQPFAISHFHSPELSLPIQNPGLIGLSVVKDKLLVTVKQETGNIWSLQIPGGSSRARILGW